jgi:hypothetical protein
MEIEKRDRVAFVAQSMRYCERLEIGWSRSFRTRDPQSVINLRKALYIMKINGGKIFKTVYKSGYLTVTRTA